MSSNYPLVQIVASPDVDAELRCDLNDGTTWPLTEGFSLGTPPMLGDPGGVGGEYGYRTLTFNLVVRDGEAKALAKQSELARQLLRDTNYLLFRLSPSAAPMWFKLYRSSPGESSLVDVYCDRETNRYRLAVSLVAEPFAVGEYTGAAPDGSDTFTIGNDPATGGLSVELTNVVGDAPAPLVVELSPGTSGAIQPLMSVMPLEARSWPGTPYWQAESWTRGTATTVASNTGASSGTMAAVALRSTGESRVRRLTGSVTVPFAGRWRLFARARLTWGTGGRPTTTNVAGTGAACVTGVVTNMAGAGQAWRIIELGTYAFPKGNMPGRRPYTLGAGEVGIDAGNGNADDTFTLTLNVDYIAAVPVDLPLDQWTPPTTLEFANDQATAGDVTLRLDGETETVEQVTAGTYLPGTPEVPRGSFLYLVPGANNGLTLMPRRWNATNQHDDLLTTTTTVKAGYRPRWLYLASG